MTHPPLSRNAHIDALRGVAILCVLILHFSLSYGIRQSPLGWLPDAVVRALALHGNYGVTMFFTVSGFLITGNVLQRWGSLDRVDLRSFYVLRLARIMPPLLPVLALIVVLGSLGLPSFANTDGDHHLPAAHFLLGAGSVLTFWHNALMQSTGYFNYCLNIYWSLSVEEMFYLLMPLLCVASRRVWVFVLACLLAVAAGPLYRAAHADNELFFMYGYLACFDAIAIGCLTALLAHRLKLAAGGARALRWSGALAMAALYLRGYHGIEAIGFSLMALACAVFLLGAASAPAVAGAPIPGRRPLAWLCWVGRHSYEIYLYHIVVLALLRNLVQKPQLSHAMRLPLLLLFLALSAALAALVARTIAAPANRALRRRWLVQPEAVANGVGVDGSVIS